MRYQRLAAVQRQQLQKIFAAFYADSFEYSEDHLAFLRQRRDSFLQSLKA